MRTHPHAEAAYRVVPLSGGAFGVEVTIPGTHPTIVSSFADEPAAEEWIVQKKIRVETDGSTGRQFQRMAPRRRNPQPIETP